MLNSKCPNISPWKPYERKKLSVLVQKYLDKRDEVNWVEISNTLNSTRSPMDCYIQYKNVDDPLINKGSWNIKEELSLLKIATEYQETNWALIAEKLGTNRTPWQCFEHYQQALNPNIVKSGEWSEAEDNSLKEAIALHGLKNWRAVSDLIPGRSSFQCNLRWRRSITCKEGVVEGRWSIEDENRLVLAAIAYDAPLSYSAKKTTAEIEEMRSLTAEYTESSPDSDRLNIISKLKPQKLSPNANHATGFSWKAIANLIPGKDENKCREKWVNYLDPTISREPFTLSEDSLLKNMVRIVGPGSWAAIVQFFPCRTDNQILHRWKQIQDTADVLEYTHNVKKRRKMGLVRAGRSKAITFIKPENHLDQVAEVILDDH